MARCAEDVEHHVCEVITATREALLKPLSPNCMYEVGRYFQCPVPFPPFPSSITSPPASLPPFSQVEVCALRGLHIQSQWLRFFVLTGL